MPDEPSAKKGAAERGRDEIADQNPDEGHPGGRRTFFRRDLYI